MSVNIKELAGSYAEEYCNGAIHPAHLFKAALHKESGLAAFVEKDLDKDYYYLQEWADVQMQLLPKTVRRVAGDLACSPEAVAVLEEADNYKLKFGLTECEPVCVLAALVTPGVGFTFEQLKTLPLNAAEICAKQGLSPARTPVVGAASPAGGGQTGKYCIDKLAEAREGNIPTVIGFEREIATIYESLSRKNKLSLLITGESGTGKTSLLNGFITQLAEGRVPAFLRNASVYELDLAAISTDISYKGEVENRFKSLVSEVTGMENCILIIESIHKLFDKQSSLYGASDLLKQELSKGRLLLLCTATIDGYTKYIETDKEFVSRLEKISVEQPNADLCLRILKGATPAYADYHHLTLSEPVLVDAIRLSRRYLTEKSLPASAFDLIDRSMGLVRTMNDMTAGILSRLTKELDALIAQSKTGDADEATLMKELEWLNYEMTNTVSCILLARLDTDTDFSKIGAVEARIDFLKQTLTRLGELGSTRLSELESVDLSAVVAKETGIPLGKVQSKERDRLVNAQATLKQRVVGQDYAVKKVLDAVFESRSGLGKEGQPMGSFFFLGPTGTGKTELSKALSSFLFEDESSLIRFDMSEFKEEHSVALLYGAPPGYVGYDEGGLLVNKIRQKPYSVVLFDEIEKAHKSVFDLFLQILDEGKLHDRLGRTGDFSNALIIFTSNIGSQFIVDSYGKGQTPQSNDLLDIMQQYFRPEFLGRLTEIVPFSPITEETVTRIFDIHLKGLLKLLDAQDVKLEMSDEVKRDIAMKGFNPQYGARPIIGVIRKELRQPLSKLIITGQVKSHDTVKVQSEDGQLKFITK
ncbi:MAG: ATP-dependent Clp protease ATP-binding subunit [Prevotella sp.]|jgi:ATP-dependent Clp protease ATP-binding subunit ClpA|nr:ATP-dependent Clp protease ATP-binding subunit [Prevotella sp.]